jgi:hypothetical protein
MPPSPSQGRRPPGVRKKTTPFNGLPSEERLQLRLHYGLVLGTSVDDD